MCSNPLFQDGDQPLVAGGERPLGAVDQPEGVDHFNAALDHPDLLLLGKGGDGEAGQHGKAEAAGDRLQDQADLVGKAAQRISSTRWPG